MTRTVIALYENLQDANSAIRELVDNGFKRDDISLMAGDQNGNYRRMLSNKESSVENTDVSGASEGAGVGAGIGAVLGGIGGLLVGLGALVIPGVGPVIAAGPLAAVLSGLAGAGAGAIAGGITGGLIGALVDIGVPEETANYYSEGVRRGGTLLTIRTDDNMSGRAVNIMNRHNPVDINSKASEWRESGWTGFNETSTEAPDTQGESSKNVSNVVENDQRSTEDRSGTDPGIPSTGDRDRMFGGVGPNPQSYGNTGTAPSGQDFSQGGSRGADMGVMGERERETQSDYDPSRNRTDFSPSEPRGQMDSTGQNVGTRDASQVGDQDRGMPGNVQGQDVTSSGFMGQDTNIENKQGRMEDQSSELDATRMTDRENEMDSGTSTEQNRDFYYYDTAFEHHFVSFYGTTYAYDQYRPAYRYGYDLASDPRYRNRTWEDVEPEAQRYWDERQPGAWDRFKDAIQHAWDEVKHSAS
jgi:hypothetical protein